MGHGVGTPETSEEDPYNVFITRCRISGSSAGVLSGYDIVIKDNIQVAGIELTFGSHVLEGYVPKRDAIVVQRILKKR